MMSSRGLPFVNYKYNRRASISNMNGNDPMWWPALIRQTFEQLGKAEHKMDDLRFFLICIFGSQIVLIVMAIFIILTMCWMNASNRNRSQSCYHILESSKAPCKLSDGPDLIESPDVSRTDSINQFSVLVVDGLGTESSEKQPAPASAPAPAPASTPTALSVTPAKRSRRPVSSPGRSNVHYYHGLDASQGASKLTRRTRVSRSPLPPPIVNQTSDLEHIFDDIEPS